MSKNKLTPEQRTKLLLIGRRMDGWWSGSKPPTKNGFWLYEVVDINTGRPGPEIGAMDPHRSWTGVTEQDAYNNFWPHWHAYCERLRNEPTMFVSN